MVLQQLQCYLREHPHTSLAELEQHFQIEADALRGMLDKLIQKGRVRKESGKSCSGCHSCSQASLEFYEWLS